MRLHRLGAKEASIWAHIWTVHVPQLLHKWGTLCPWSPAYLRKCCRFMGGTVTSLVAMFHAFLCHGVEGRYKAFKRELTLTSGNQWKDHQVVFNMTLSHDRIRWALYENGYSEHGRYRTGRKQSESRALRDYEAAVRTQIDAWGQGLFL